MDRANAICEEAKIAREGLRNRHALVQNGNVMVMKDKGKHLILNYPSGELIINEDKDFPCTFESYSRLLVLSFTKYIKIFNHEHRNVLYNISFKIINSYFQKLKELLKRDVTNKEKFTYYTNIINQILCVANNYEQELIDNENPYRSLLVTSAELVAFFRKILSILSEIDEDIKKSYKTKK